MKKKNSDKLVYFSELINLVNRLMILEKEIDLLIDRMNEVGIKIDKYIDKGGGVMGCSKPKVKPTGKPKK